MCGGLSGDTWGFEWWCVGFPVVACGNGCSLVCT